MPNNKLSLPKEFVDELTRYMWAVDKYTSLTNDDYETDFYEAGQEIERLGTSLNRMMSRSTIVE